MRFHKARLKKSFPGVIAVAIMVATVALLLFVKLDEDRPPEAVIVIPGERVNLNEPVIMSGSNSTDPDGDGDELRYLWTIDDHFWSDLPELTYSFVERGNFTVSLKVMDGDGLSDVETVFIEVV